MSVSEVWLLVRRLATADDGDAPWLERWLSEMLGIRIRVVLTSHIEGADIPPAARVAYTGDETILAAAHNGVRLPPSAADPCDLARLRLRRRQRNEGKAAVLDQAVVDIGQCLDS